MGAFESRGDNQPSFCMNSKYAVQLHCHLMLSLVYDAATATKSEQHFQACQCTKSKCALVCHYYLTGSGCLYATVLAFRSWQQIFTIKAKVVVSHPQMIDVTLHCIYMSNATANNQNSISS